MIIVSIYKPVYWTDFKLDQILKANKLQIRLEIGHFKDLYSRNLRKGHSKQDIQIIGIKLTC